MTGAGSVSHFCFAKEQPTADGEDLPGDLVDSDSDGTPEYYGWGRNATIADLTLNRQADRLNDPTEVESVESTPGKLEGTLTVEGTVSDLQTHLHDIIFSDGSGFTSGQPPLSRVFLGVSHIDGSVGRELRGCVPQEYSLSFDDDTSTVTYSLTLGFAMEPDTPSTIDPSNITTASTGETAPFHGFSFSLDSATVSKLSTCELTISNISRYHYGPNQEPVDATIAKPEVEVSATAIFTSGSADRLELAYGGSGASSLQSDLSSVNGEIDVQGPSGSLASYTLPSVALNEQSWENVISEEDTTDSVTGHVNGGIEVA
jgi:hypothetical protein